MLTRPLAALAAIMLGAGLAAASAPAANAAESSSPVRNCWQEVDTGKSLCVDSGVNIADAVYAKYGIELSTSDGTVARSASVSSKAAAKPAAAAASTVIGILYKDSNYRGETFTASVSENGCHGYSHGYTNMSSFGWANVVSSFRSYSNCRTAIFEKNNYAGAQYGYTANAASVGALNDKANSVRWTA